MAKTNIFSKKEYENYVRQKDKAVFSSPEEEFDWASTETKICIKCGVEKNLTCFSGNTSGCDAFNKNGYRLRRPECVECTKIVSAGKNIAKKIAHDQGIAFMAPPGTKCSVCNKLQSSNNKLVFDHCHKKNIFRGYCCNSCNRSLGVLGDDIGGLINALNYLLITDKVKIKQSDDYSLVVMDDK